jgi:hypothetical protein
MHPTLIMALSKEKERERTGERRCYLGFRKTRAKRILRKARV